MRTGRSLCWTLLTDAFRPRLSGDLGHGEGETEGGGGREGEGALIEAVMLWSARIAASTCCY